MWNNGEASYTLRRVWLMLGASQDLFKIITPLRELQKENIEENFLAESELSLIIACKNPHGRLFKAVTKAPQSTQ